MGYYGKRGSVEYDFNRFNSEQRNSIRDIYNDLDTERVFAKKSKNGNVSFHRKYKNTGDHYVYEGDKSYHHKD